jgi:uncharacterized cupin superfamily protein
MPKIDVSKLPVRKGAGYPAQLNKMFDGREKTALGNGVDLTQFGVNLTRIKPGSASALRHWHEKEDEFVYMLEGELVLVEDEGETVLKPGDCAGFKAGVKNGHQLVNRSNKDAVYLEVGTRSNVEYVGYPDHDLIVVRDEKGARALHRSGEPY